jgi:hypothetical protein
MSSQFLSVLLQTQFSRLSQLFQFFNHIVFKYVGLNAVNWSEPRVQKVGGDLSNVVDNISNVMTKIKCLEGQQCCRWSVADISCYDCKDKFIA